MKSHHDLKVWHASIQLATSVYGLTRKFPDEERYGLTSQMRRAAISIASNIAEGTDCYVKKVDEFLCIPPPCLAEPNPLRRR